MPKISPFLWFDNNAEEAMNFYISIFKNSSVLSVSRYPEGAPGLAGEVMVATFQVDGQQIMVLNGGPVFKFNEAISFFVTCDDQAEVDWYWNQLTAGGEEGQCGWLKDKFGLSWQIVPTGLGVLLSDPDLVKAQRVMQAMLKMQKIDLTGLQNACDQP